MGSDHNNTQNQEFIHHQLLYRAIETIEDYAIFLMDANGVIQTWNKGAELIKGHKKAEIVGKHFSIFYTEEDLLRKHPQEELEMAGRLGKFSEEGWRKTKSGQLFWASVLITALKDSSGKIIGYSKVTKDLTERRSAENAIRVSEARFRLLIEGIKDYAIFLLDPKGIVATWNEGAKRLKGYEADEVIGQHFSKFYLAEEVEEGKCEYQLKEATLTGRIEDEGWRLRKDGTRFWANVVITAVRDSAGRLTGFSKVTRDLTEKKRSEERLKRVNEGLEKRVIKRTRELTKAKEELERAITIRDQFFSIASHELKTPITSLKLQAQLLSMGFNKSESYSEDKIKNSVKVILKQADKLNSLIDYMLDLSRAKLGRFTFNFEDVDLTDLIESIYPQWQAPFEATKGELSVDVAPEVHIFGDKLHIEQVLSNLLTNAIKYAPGSHTWLTLKKDYGEAVINVADNGPGISEEKIDKIFERYERASTNEGVTGFGLGLYLAKVIVDAHHGSINVTSSPGKGSSFTIRIPLAEL